MGKQKSGKFSKSEGKWDLDYFCRTGKVLRLRQRMKLSEKSSVNLKLDLEFFVQEEQSGEGILTRNYFVRKEKGRGIGLRIFLSKSKREKGSKVKQVRRGVRSPVRSAAKKSMIESLSQIGSKITACCHFMQPIKNWLVPSMLATGANRKIVVRTFCENDLCKSNGFFIPSVFLRYHCH